MSASRETIGPRLSSFAGKPEEWLAYVKSLRAERPSSASKSVPEVSVHWGKRVLVRFSRPRREVTERELELLAAEYEKPIAELRDLFTSRKIRILDSEGNQTNAKPERKRTSRPKAKTNAGANET